MNIDILKPAIFPEDKILSGVTKKNIDSFPPCGMSFTEAETYSNEEIENHKTLFAEYMNVKKDFLKFQHQVHGTTIQVIDKSSYLKDSDGMITDQKSIVLCVKIADCCAILVYDPNNHAIGAFHSGWRGTQQKISQVGIRYMQKKYGSVPYDMMIYLSPCASGKNYEVGYDVAQYFPKNTRKKDNGKYLFDNQQEIYDHLLEIGADEKKIERSEICTIEDRNYHSYRRDNEESGRMCAFISLRNQ